MLKRISNIICSWKWFEPLKLFLNGQEYLIIWFLSFQMVIIIATKLCFGNTTPIIIIFYYSINYCDFFCLAQTLVMSPKQRLEHLDEHIFLVFIFWFCKCNPTRNLGSNVGFLCKIQRVFFNSFFSWIKIAQRKN